MNTLILIATLSIGSGRTLSLYDHSANCAYPTRVAAIVNSANKMLFETCWRVDNEKGRIVLGYSANLLVESFDWTVEGRKLLRKVTKR